MGADIFIISNGPGELSAWVRPVVSTLRQQLPGARITIALVPCPYASGREAQTIASWEDEVHVWAVRDTLRFLFTGRPPEGEGMSEVGAVLFMGGDQAFGVWLSGRLGYPLLVYTETTGRWGPFVHRFMASDPGVYKTLRTKAPAGKISLVGNLMVDAVRPRLDPLQVREALGLAPDRMVVSLLPGSKPFKVKYITPLLLKVAEELAEERPDLQFVLHRSPFTSLADLEEAISTDRYARVTGGCQGLLHREGSEVWLETPRGTQIQVIGREHHYEGMSIADLALTVPGTNTAELAILGIPMLVLLPLNKPEEIPLEGLLGQLGTMPALGKWIKRMVVKTLLRKMRFFALPNQRAGAPVTPELVGMLSPEAITQAALELLEDDERRREIKLGLHEVMGYPGAAEAIVDLVREALTRQTRPVRLVRPAPHPEQQESKD